ncbi:hypothetical protein NC653_021015 [Populus alba x Populus x berolinensis]|uniref:Uncharacterized protein n=1 Tax=Populus alba x Populus x berolinensis TaxID=444605 RepID=A0AAD6MNR7_9ROSI|nr:hypothetical protein NC653_021015 [Populus alba x Populus x berolinensis]
MDFSYKNFKVGTCAGQKEVDGETMPILSQPPEHNKSDTEKKKMMFFCVFFVKKKKPKKPANQRAGRSQALGCVRGD